MYVVALRGVSLESLRDIEGVQETSDPMSKKVSIYGYLREIMLLIYKRDERGYFFHNEIVSRCAMERINIEIYE